MQSRVSDRGAVLRLFVTIFIPSLSLSPGIAAEQTRRSPLAGVAALEKSITLSETKIPIGELVQKVAAETGVDLTARREVADEPVALAVNEMLARELLEQVADFLEYTWVRKPRAEGEKPAFELWQSVAAKQREEALQQAGAAAAWQNLRAEIPGRKRRCDPTAHQALVELLRRPPTDFGIESATWTGADLAAVAQQQGIAVCLSARTARREIQRAGYRWQQAKRWSAQEPEYERKKTAGSPGGARAGGSGLGAGV